MAWGKSPAVLVRPEDQRLAKSADRPVPASAQRRGPAMARTRECPADPAGVSGSPSSRAPTGTQGRQAPPAAGHGLRGHRRHQRLTPPCSAGALVAGRPAAKPVSEAGRARPAPRQHPVTSGVSCCSSTRPALAVGTCCSSTNSAGRLSARCQKGRRWRGHTGRRGAPWRAAVWALRPHAPGGLSRSDGACAPGCLAGRPAGAGLLGRRGAGLGGQAVTPAGPRPARPQASRPRAWPAPQRARGPMRRPGRREQEPWRRRVTRASGPDGHSDRGDPDSRRVAGACARRWQGGGCPPRPVGQPAEHAQRGTAPPVCARGARTAPGRCGASEGFRSPQKTSPADRTAGDAP